jgi:hypothetical protein
MRQQTPFHATLILQKINQAIVVHGAGHSNLLTSEDVTCVPLFSVFEDHLFSLSLYFEVLQGMPQYSA